MQPSVHTSQDPEQRRPFHRDDIQGLRALAVLLVIVSHVGVAQLAGGYIGVDVFFVVSGFLITGLLLREAKRRRRISLVDFYARRARRILPAATVVLVTTIVASFLLLGRLRGDEVVRDGVLAALFAVNWKFSTDGTDYFASGLPPSPLQHYWSLAVEEQFYLLWPGLVLAVLFGFAARGSRHRGRRRYAHRPSVARRAALAAAVGVLGIVSLTYSILFSMQAPASAYFSTFTRLWELAAGALLAIGAGLLGRIPLVAKRVMGWVGLVGIGASAVLFTESTTFPGVAALLPVLSTALVITGGIDASRSGAGALLGIAPLRWLGDRSYSLYLWHWPLLVIGASYLGRELSLAQGGVLMLGALVLTMATYTFIEHPIHRGGVLAGRARGLLLWPASFAILSVVAVVSLYAVRSGPATAGSDPAFAAPPVASDLPGATGTPTPAAPVGDAEPSPDDPIGQAVSAAVAAADAGESVPAALSPPLALLREDTWQQYVDPVCTAETGETTHEICSFGPADAPRSLAIFGDSRAGMWLPVLSSIADAAGSQVYYFVKPGCVGADLSTGLRELILDAEPQRADALDECAAWYAWAVQRIVDLAPDLVILSNRGVSALPGRNGLGIALAGWEDSITATMRNLGQTVPRVMIFSQTPDQREDPLSCLDKPDAGLDDCTSDLGGDVRGLNDANKRAADAVEGEFLDLLPWLCSSLRCPMVVSQMIVYYDEGHLTRTYTLAIADQLRAAIES